MTLKTIVRDACPGFALQAYRLALEWIAPVKLANPVVQMYINDGEVQTVAGFNNFLSFLTAGATTSGRLRLELRDPDGALLVEQYMPVDRFENRFIDVRALLAQHGKQSPLGLISLVFAPDKLRTRAYKKLGVLASQFFIFYRGGTGSVAMVHPSSTLDPKSPPSGPFITNQLIDTTGLEAVALYQCNPSQVPHELTIGLQNAQTKAIVCSETLVLPPLSTRKVAFAAGSAFSPNEGALRVYTSSLPTANSKPMLCRVYAGGRFSMSHS